MICRLIRSPLLVIVCCWPGLAAAYSGPPQALPITSGMRSLIRSSAYIFAGTVLAVEHIKPLPNELPTVRISFHVDQAIRGVQQGQTLSVREWALVWNSGERYRRGDRVLLFLYPLSKLGLTSVVAGSGRFDINARGEILVEQNPMSIVRDEPVQQRESVRRNRLPNRSVIQALRRAAQE
jgi:hypothetical protein